MCAVSSPQVLSEWKGATAGGKGGVEHCPALRLAVARDCRAVIELQVPSRRPKGLKEYNVSVSPLVFAGEGGGRRAVAAAYGRARGVKGQRVATPPGGYARARCNCLEVCVARSRRRGWRT